MNTSIDGWQVPNDDDSDDVPAEATAKSTNVLAELTPVCSGRRGLLLLACMIVVADTCLYRAMGFSGPAVFLPIAAMIVILGIPRQSFRTTTLVLLAMLGIASVRLAMNGSSGLLAVSFWLLASLPYCLRGWPPFLFETLVFAAQSVPGGYDFFRSVNLRVRESVLTPIDEGRPNRWLGIALPVGSALLFGTIFLFANPQLLRVVSSYLADLIADFQQWLRHFSFVELLFWGTVAWLTAGALRPIPLVFRNSANDTAGRPQAPSSMYQPFQRTLLTVIALFAGYLVFEFYTLSSNTYEKGFGFSDYAHEGAMWLTVALTVATLLLSLIFRGSIFADPRIGLLRNLAWIWIALNLILAIAVYTRLFIYIDYNGMTRMRTVGLLGVTVVVGGFALMRFKIRWQREFYWLVQRQLWILGLAVFVYFVLPVDFLCHRYNVARIVAGDHAPTVQLAIHPIDNEALPVLLPLLDSDQQEIQQGIEAILRNRLAQLRQDASSDWSAWQYSNTVTVEALIKRLDAEKTKVPAGILAKREAHEHRFRTFAMEWF